MANGTDKIVQQNKIRIDVKKDKFCVLSRREKEITENNLDQPLRTLDQHYPQGLRLLKGNFSLLVLKMGNCSLSHTQKSLLNLLSNGFLNFSIDLSKMTYTKPNKAK